MTKLQLLGQYSFFEKIQLILMWAYDRTLGTRRKGIYELKHLIHDAGDRFSFQRQGKYNRITGEGITVLARRTSSDVPVFSQVFYYQEYQAVVDAIHDRDRIKYIIDGGANVGYTSLFFEKQFPHATILSVEPEAGNYAMMLKNFELNNFKATPVQAALWHTAEHLAIDRSFREHRDWSVAVKPGGSDIEGITISELCKKYHFPRIDILKLDIEGAERYLFDTQEDVEGFLPMTRYLAIEIHEEYRIKDKILKFLEQFGFSHFPHPHGELVIAINEKYS